MFPKGLVRFVNLYLDSGIREKIELSCNIEGKDMRYTYYNCLLDHYLNTKFEDQTYYNSVKDLPQKELEMAVKALDYFLGMGPGNGNEYLYNIFNSRYTAPAADMLFEGLF